MSCSMSNVEWIVNHKITVNLHWSLREKCTYSEFFWSVFSRIRTEYREALRISPYSVQMRENTDQKNPKYGHFLHIACSSRKLSEKHLIPETIFKKVFAKKRQKLPSSFFHCKKILSVKGDLIYKCFLITTFSHL